MGMTNIQKELVRYVAENNLQKAKLAALGCCREDTTQMSIRHHNCYAMFCCISFNGSVSCPYGLVICHPMKQIQYRIFILFFHMSDSDLPFRLLRKDYLHLRTHPQNF